jgi:hypothetical protein
MEFEKIAEKNTWAEGRDRKSWKKNLHKEEFHNLSLLSLG